MWQRLPETDRALLSHRTRLVVDDPLFLPQAHSSEVPVWGMALSIGVRKSIAIVCLSPHSLPRQPNEFVHYVMAHTLSHVFCGHLEQLFRSSLDESTSEEEFDSEANRQVSAWGFPIVPPTQPPK